METILHFPAEMETEKDDTCPLEKNKPVITQQIGGLGLGYILESGSVTHPHSNSGNARK